MTFKLYNIIYENVKTILSTNALKLDKIKLDIMFIFFMIIKILDNM